MIISEDEAEVVPAIVFALETTAAPSLGTGQGGFEEGSHDGRTLVQTPCEMLSTSISPRWSRPFVSVVLSLGDIPKSKNAMSLNNPL